VNEKPESDGILPDRFYTISEVSEQVGVAPHVLRQWQDRFSTFRPKRDPINRRRYTAKDILIAKRINYYLHHIGMTSEGADKQIKKDFAVYGTVNPAAEATDLITQIENEALAMIESLEKHRPKPALRPPADA
jgi:DNA-binding transcriptional MerR regulator